MAKEFHQIAAGALLDVAYPLTPALSRGERFPRTEVSRIEPLNATLLQKLPVILPLPRREGRGEGERDVRQPALSKAAPNERRFRGRESPRTALECSNDLRFAGRLVTIPPLLWGEGRGEGEQGARPETTSDASKLNCRASRRFS